MCDSNDCDKPPTHRGFWPGKPPILWCEPCKDRGLEIAKAMSFHLHTEPYTPPVQWLDDDHLFGYLSAHDDDDAPDGAWWAKLEDGVTFYNEQYHTNHDPHETVHAYIAQKASEDGD